MKHLHHEDPKRCLITISADSQSPPTDLVLLLRNVVQRQRQQEVLGTDKQATPLLVQQQGTEAARALQLEAPHAVELLQLCKHGPEEHGFRFGWGSVSIPPGVGRLAASRQTARVNVPFFFKGVIVSFACRTVCLRPLCRSNVYLVAIKPSTRQ